MAQVPLVAAIDAIALVSDGKGWLLDVREPHEWDAGHAEQAHSLPMSQIQDRFGELPTDEPLIVVCQAGYRSSRVTAALIDAGYDATNVDGGMLSWVQAGGDLVAEGDDSPRVV